MHSYIYINKPSPKKSHKSGRYRVGAADKRFEKLLFDPKTGDSIVEKQKFWTKDYMMHVDRSTLPRLAMANGVNASLQCC